MTVVRVKKTRDFTVMSNTHLRDRSLSFKAKGVLSFMLSLCVSSSRFFVNHHPILSGLSTKVFRISPRAAGPTLPSCFPA